MYTYVAAVQDASLLAMLRVGADCDEVPLEVTTTVTELGQFSRRHIRRVSPIVSVLLVDLTWVSRLISLIPAL
jgi:hypothetical protein